MGSQKRTEMEIIKKNVLMLRKDTFLWDEGILTSYLVEREVHFVNGLLHRYNTIQEIDHFFL